MTQEEGKQEITETIQIQIHGQDEDQDEDRQSEEELEEENDFFGLNKIKENDNMKVLTQINNLSCFILRQYTGPESWNSF